MEKKNDTSKAINPSMMCGCNQQHILGRKFISHQSHLNPPVPLVETLPFCTLAGPRSSIDVAWIYMVGKGLLAATGSPACYLAYTGG